MSTLPHYLVCGVLGRIKSKFLSVIAAGADLVVNLNSNATTSNMATLIAAATYENTDTDNPTTGARTVDVSLSDGDGGTSSTAGITVTVSASNDAPTVAVNTGLPLNEGATSAITGSELNEGDPDDSGTGLTYTVTTTVTNGTLWVDADDSGTVNGAEAAISANDTFTQEDIDNGYVKYAHNGGETTSDSFIFSLADGGENGVSAVTTDRNLLFVRPSMPQTT